MSNELTKKAAEMLLNGATLLSEPCPYCKGVRVMKEGHALCIKCGREPEKRGTPKKEKPKENSLKIAKKYNAQIITITGDSKKKWIFNTWDKFYLPKPFGTITIHIAPPYEDNTNVPGDLTIFFL